jgi:hypothetical protein
VGGGPAQLHMENIRMGGAYYTEYRTVPYRILFRPYKILNFLEFLTFTKKATPIMNPFLFYFYKGSCLNKTNNLSFDIYKVKFSYLFIFFPFFLYFLIFFIKSRAGFSAPVGSFSSFSAPAKQEITKI